MESIYHRLGEQNLRVMVDNFYHYVMEDNTINHLFTTDMELVKKKQILFLTGFLGGPSIYVAEYGPPRMKLRHMPHAITEKSAISWLKNIRKAIWKLKIDESLKIEIFNRFPRTAAHMVNS
ncbi:globin [Saprospiraceae bacterium]|nr:globin [Saprospiraceae bacterium]